MSQAASRGGPVSFSPTNMMTGPVDRTGSQLGSVDESPEDMWRSALSGLQRTETYTPMFGGAFRSGSSTTNPMELQDIAQAAMGDVEAMKGAKAQNVETIEKSAQGIENAYADSQAKLEDHLAGVREQLNEYTGIQEKAEGEFERARQYAHEARGQITEHSGKMEERAEELRTEGLEKYKSSYALRMSQASRGMHEAYQRKIDNVDQMAGQGAINGYGGHTGSDVASAMKSQLAAEYQDQLRGFAGQLGAEEMKLSSQLRQDYDKMVVNTMSVAGQQGAGGAMGAANIWADLAKAEASVIPMIHTQRMKDEIDLLRINTGIQHLAVKAPEIAAQLRTMPEYLAEPVLLAPLFQELWSMYEGRTTPARTGGGGSVTHTGQYTGMRPQIAQPGFGGAAGGQGMNPFGGGAGGGVGGPPRGTFEQQGGGASQPGSITSDRGNVLNPYETPLPGGGNELIG